MASGIKVRKSRCCQTGSFSTWSSSSLVKWEGEKYFFGGSDNLRFVFFKVLFGKFPPIITFYICPHVLVVEVGRLQKPPSSRSWLVQPLSVFWGGGPELPLTSVWNTWFIVFILFWCHAEKCPTLRGWQDTKRKQTDQTPETQHKDIRQKGWEKTRMAT